MSIPKFFEFTDMTRIVYSVGAIDLAGREAAKLGMKKPLIAADAVMVEKGYAAKIEESLKKAGIEPAAVFSDIPQDSDLEVVEKGYALTVEKGADSLIAVGGGSTIDTAKGIGIMMAMGGRLPEGVNIIDKDLPPFIAVPSTAGTGSEMTFGAVIKDKKRQMKLVFQSMKVASDVALLDPAITASMPPKLTASTAMDALSHAIEALHSTSNNPLSDGLALHAIGLIDKNVVQAVKDGADLDARGAMLIASATAGLAFGNSLVGCVHAMAHACGGVFGLPHGVANAVLLPYGMEYNLDCCEEIYAGVARAFDIDVKGLSQREAALRAIARVRALAAEIGMPRSLREAGIPEEGLDEIVEKTLLDATMFTNPRPAKAEDIKEALLKAWRGDDPAAGASAPVEKKESKPAAPPKPKEPEKEERKFIPIEKLYELATNFSERVFHIPEIEAKLKETKLIFQFKYFDELWGDKEAVITVDGSGDTVNVIAGDTEIQPTVKMRMHADTANAFWKQKLNLMAAVSQGKITVEGSLPEAMRLLPSLKPAFALYAQSLKEVKIE